MAVSKKKMINNSSLSNNVSMFSGFLPGLRALVVNQKISGLESVAVKDFYHVVIVESVEAISSVPVPDFAFYASDSPYENYILAYDELSDLEQTIVCSNFKSVFTFDKLSRDLPTPFSVNYLPSSSLPSSEATIERAVQCGLNKDSPGVHLALIMGCSNIYYTGTSSKATHVTLSDIIDFTTVKSKFTFSNLIKPGRGTVLIERL